MVSKKNSFKSSVILVPPTIPNTPVALHLANGPTVAENVKSDTTIATHKEDALGFPLAVAAFPKLLEKAAMVVPVFAMDKETA